MATWPTFPIQGSRLVSAFRGDFNSIIDALVSAFVGATAPTVTYACMLWADTSEGTLKQRNTTNTGWNVVKLLNYDYGGMMPLSGGTMTGPINMNNQGITNLPAGSGASPARYTDLAAYAKLDGSTPFTGIPTLPATTPTLDNHAARKKYVDDTIYAGGTYTGQISMGVSPTSANHVMRKTDVETIRDTHTHSGALNMGSKISVVALNTNGVSAHKVPASDGQNSSQWEMPYADNIKFESNGVEVALPTVPSSGSWQQINIAAYVPVATVAVAVYAERTGSFWDLRFRAWGSSAAGIRCWQAYNNEGAELRTPFVVPVVGRMLDVKAIRGGGSEDLHLIMVYHIERGA